MRVYIAAIFVSILLGVSAGSICPQFFGNTGGTLGFTGTPPSKLFPQNEPESPDYWSPDRKYVIHNDHSFLDSEHPNHNVVSLKVGGEKTGKQFLTFERCVDVLWAPDSSAFVVNNWVGSDLCETSLYRVNEIGKPINLREELMKTLHDPSFEKQVADSDHIYFVVNNWISPTKLVLTVMGYGANPGFERLYYYDLNGASQLVKIKDYDAEKAEQ
jgi:hypothetical protein